MRAMKDSRIEWIGTIPAEWTIAKVKNFYDVVLGKMLQTTAQKDDDKLCSYMCAANIKWDGITLDTVKRMWFSESDRKVFLLEKGDLLVTEGGDVATSCLWNAEVEECYIQNAVHRVRPKTIWSNKFLYYWLFTLKKSGYIDMACNKATLPHFTKDKLGNCIVPVLPREEQLRIVEYLDEKCSDIDSLISCKEKTNVLLREQRQSIIYEAVTKGMNPDAPMKDSGVEWIGAIPKTWNLVALKRIAEFTTGSTPSKNNPEFWEGDIAWLSSKDLKADYLYDSQDHITQKAVDECGLKLLPENSLVICVRSGILRHTFPVAITKMPTTINQDLRSMELCKDCVPDYLLYYLRGMNDTIVKLYQKIGATVESIEMDWLLYLPVVLPSYQEQLKIVEYLHHSCNKIDTIISANELTIQKLKEYRQSVIFEAVTGKIEV